MKLPWEMTKEQAEKRKNSIRSFWEYELGIKVGDIVGFKTIERGNDNHNSVRIRKGKLIDFYPHIAVFDFGNFRRAIRNKELARILGGEVLEL